MSGKAKNINLIATIQLLVAGVLLGTAGTAITYAPKGTSIIALGFCRVFIGSLFLILIMPILKGKRKNILKLIKHPTVWVMALSTAAYQPLFFGATSRNGVGLSTLITVGSTPFFTSILGWFVMKEKINFSWVCATSLAVIGLVIRSWGLIHFKDLLGFFMALTAGFGVAFYLNAARLEMRRKEYQLEVPATAYLISSICLIPFAWGNSFHWIFSLRGILVALFLGLVSMAFANSFQTLGLQHASTGPVATLQLADPLTATILGVALLGEPFTWTAGIGIVIVSVALIWQSKSQSIN